MPLVVEFMDRVRSQGVRLRDVRVVPVERRVVREDLLLVVRHHRLEKHRRFFDGLLAGLSERRDHLDGAEHLADEPLVVLRGGLVDFCAHRFRFLSLLELRPPKMWPRRMPRMLRLSSTTLPKYARMFRM